MSIRNVVDRISYTVLLGLLVFGSSNVKAGGAGGLPWEAPLQQLADSLTGPVAGAIALVAVIVTGAALIFGGEMSDFIRRVTILVFVLALLGGAAVVVQNFFGAGGASIVASAPIDASEIIAVAALGVSAAWLAITLGRRSRAAANGAA